MTQEKTTQGRRPFRNLSVLILFVAAQVAAQTQSGQNQDACTDYKSADQALNATYTRVLKDYGKNTQFVAKMRASQRAWLAFRDADLDAMFPAPDKQSEYGSVYPVCRCGVLKDLTELRTGQLKVWLDGIPEGDVCGGSVKTALAKPEFPSKPRAESCELRAGLQ